MNDRINNTVKPCPFCGNDAEIYSAVTRTPYDDGSLQGHWVVDCTECDASIEFCSSPEDAANKWNTRKLGISDIIKDCAIVPKDRRRPF